MPNEALYNEAFMQKHASAQERHPELATSVLGGLYLHCYSLVTSAFLTERSVARLIDVAKEIEEMHDRTTSMVTDSIQLPQHDEPQKIELACAQSCTYCCHIRLTSTPLEVIGIAERLRTSGNAEPIIESLKKYEESVNGMPPEKRLFHLEACPFLIEQLCSIYKIRPSACRTYHSFDLNRCIMDFEDPKKMLGVPQNPVRLDIGSALFDAEEQACKELGLEHCVLEFVTGLRIALEDSSLVARWLSGEECFAEAVNQSLNEYSEMLAEQMNPEN